MLPKRRRSWLSKIGLVLATLVVLIIILPWTLGMFMPKEHVGRGETVVAAPIADVWKTVSGFDEMGKWAPDIADMTRVSDVNGLPSYEMRGGESTITFTFREVSPPSRLVVWLLDNAEAYGGTWTYDLETVGTGTRVRITEEGWTEPAYFRFVLWVFGFDRTINGYLEALAHKHGQG